MNRANECFIYMLFKHLTTLWDPFQNDLKWHHYFMRKIGTANPLETNGVWHTHFKKTVIGFNDDMKVKRPLGHCFQHL